MSVFWGNDDSARTEIRRNLRAARERDRRLTMRHRWYAGAIATVLSGALMFAGMSPASAEAAAPAPTPTATDTGEATPTDGAGAPSEEGATTPTPPAGEGATDPSAPPTATDPEPAPVDPAQQDPDGTAPAGPAPQSRSAAPQGAPVAPLALVAADCTTNCANLTMRVNVVNTGGGTATVADWSLKAVRDNGTADEYAFTTGQQRAVPRNSTYTLSATATAGIQAMYSTSFSCTTNSGQVDVDQSGRTVDFPNNSGGGGTLRAADCTFTQTYLQPGTITIQKGGLRTGGQSVAGLQNAVFEVYKGGDASTPDTSPANLVGSCTTGANGQCAVSAPSGAQYWIVEKTAPGGWAILSQLNVGGSASDLPYRFRTDTVGAGSNTTYPKVGTGNDATTSGGFWADIKTNPTAIQACGVRVGLLIDLSNSINDSEFASLKTAANGFVDALQGTPSSLAVWTFASNAPASGGSNSTLGLTSVATPSGATTVKNKISGLVRPGGDAGATNWDQGLWQVAGDAANKVDVLLMLTDGTPTVYGPNAEGPGGSSRFREVENAVFSANSVKNLGTRVVPVGIGVDGAEANIQAISGPTVSSDYYLVDNYAALAAFLQNLAKGQCESTINVTKMVIPNGGTTANATPTPGWGFGATSGHVVTPTDGTTNASGAISFKVAGLAGGASAPVTITEENRAGYTAVPQAGKNAVCKNDLGQDVSVTNVGSLGFTANATGGRIVTCTVYNEAPNPKVNLRVDKKWVINGTTYANGSQPFGAAQLTLDGQNRAFGNEYTYDVGQSVAIAESVTGLPPFCTNKSTGTGTHTVTSTPKPNVVTITNTVTCTTQLKLTKKVVGGSADPTTWTLTGTGPIGSLPGPGASSPTALTDVTPGVVYTLAESGGDPRYTQEVVAGANPRPGSTGSWHCYLLNTNGTRGAEYDGLNGGVTVQLGQHVECEAVNRTASLVLLKHVVNDNGGTAEASAWDLTATPTPLTGLTATTVDGAETAGAGNTIQVRPDHAYAISETGLTGYTKVKLQQFVGGTWVDVPGGDVKVAPGATGTYRIVNDDIAPHLTLVKKVTNNSGGTAADTAWTLSATSADGPNLNGQTGVSGAVSAGDVYTLAEANGPAGYDWNSLVCTGYPGTTKAAPTLTLEPGDDVTCTFTNDDQPARLTLVKAVDASNGGAAQPSDWNGMLRATLAGGATTSFDTGVGKDVAAGTYTLDEVQGVADYEWTKLVCSTGDVSMDNRTITVSNGQSVTCTFTNTAKKPTLTLVKKVDNKNGVGSHLAQEWTLSAAGAGGFTSPTTSGDGGVTASTGAKPVDAGTEYTLGESGPSGYDAGLWKCDQGITVTGGKITLPIGAAVTCQITNTATPATGTVAKKVRAGYPVQNANGSWTVVYDVTVTNESASSTLFYDLADALHYGGGITPTSATWSRNGGPQTSFALPAGTATLATGQPLAPSAVDTYVVTVVSAIADGTESTDAWKCTTTQSPDRGFLNTATLTVDGKTSTSQDCAQPVFPTVVKTGGTPVWDPATGRWTVSYTIAVTNPSSVETGSDIHASLADTLPTLPAGWTLVGEWQAAAVGAAPAPTDASSAASPWTIWSGTLPKATTYSYTVAGLLQPSAGATPIGVACRADGGLLNKAVVTSGQVVVDDDACVGIDTPPVTVVKSDGTVTQLVNGDWQIDYTITVTNGGASGTVYTLTDTPDLGTGFAVVSEGWQGTTPAADTPIEAGGSDQYIYRVVASFDPATEDPELTCEPGQGGAFHNIAKVQYPGGSKTDDGCAQPVSPKVEKTAIAAVQDAATGEWTIGYKVKVYNPAAIPVQYTVHDTPLALPTGVTAVGAWAASLDSIGAGNVGLLNAPWTTDHTQPLGTGSLLAGSANEYLVLLKVKVAASVPADELDCEVEGNGLWNGSRITNGVGTDESEDCVTIVRPATEQSKTVTSTAQDADGTWTITYDIVVTNTSTTEAAVYDLTDALEYGGDIEVQDASWTGPGGTDVAFTHAGDDWTAVIATDAVLAPKSDTTGTATYTVTVHAIVPAAAWDGDTLGCYPDDEDPSGGFLNTAVVTVGGVEHPVDACSEPELPTIDKTATSATQDPGDPDSWTVTYQLTVHPSGFDTFYTLTDVPGFPSGITLGDGTAQRTTPAGGAAIPIETGASFPDDPVALGADETQVWTVTWKATVTEPVPTNELTCSEGPGYGYYNAAYLYVGDDQVDHGTACIPVKEAVYPTVAKTVTSSTQDPDTGEWTVVYSLTASLAAAGTPENPDGLSAKYSLNDQLDFGAGIDIDSATWSGQGQTDVAFDDSDWSAAIAAGKPITPGATHTYTVTVKADVTAAAIDEGTTTCEEGEGPYGGFLNTAWLRSGGQRDDVHACAEPVFPTVEKTAGAYTQNDDGTQTISYLVAVAYPETDADPKPAEVGYTLTDAPTLPDGVELDGEWTAEAANAATPAVPASGASWDGEGKWTIVPAGVLTPGVPVHTYVVSATVKVTVPPSGEQPRPCLEAQENGYFVWNEAVVRSGESIDRDDACQTVHFDDVGIEKSATGLPEGGSIDPNTVFDYTLTVTNHGTRDAANVAVTDPLHERLEVTGLTLPAGWSNLNAPAFVGEGNTLEVGIPSLAVGASATIVVQVKFLPPAVPAELPEVIGDDAPPTPPVPLEELVNEACVAADHDGDPTNDCDEVTTPTRDIAALVYTRCVADAPYLGWVVTKSQSLEGEKIDFLWKPVNGAVTPATTPAQLALSHNGGLSWSEEIPWVGSAFTPSGVSIDYPGWRPIAAGDIVAGTSPAQYYLPGTATVMTPEEQAQFVFNGLILDPTELDYAWRLNTEITFTVNPTLTFSTSYPAATPDCFVARHTGVEIEKSASVERTEPGNSFRYTLDVSNVSDDAAAEDVVVTDAIPADIKITAVDWVGKGDADVFPNWQSCQVTGQDDGGYGGTLRCVLFGPLQPVDSDNGGATAAPRITLDATVNPKSASRTITNVAVVDYHTFGDPDDPGRDADDAKVLLSTLPATGAGATLPLVVLGLVVMLTGASVLIIARRRRGETKPRL